VLTYFLFCYFLSPPNDNDKGSISPTVYEQLLREQIPKAQKDNQVISGLFSLLGSLLVKAAREAWARFHQRFTYSFYATSY